MNCLRLTVIILLVLIALVTGYTARRTIFHREDSTEVTVIDYWDLPIILVPIIIAVVIYMISSRTTSNKDITTDLISSLSMPYPYTTSSGSENILIMTPPNIHTPSSISSDGSLLSLVSPGHFPSPI